MTTVWNYGGGTQSAAIAVLILKGKLPRPDYAVISDTGREKQTTWDYLSRVVQPALDSIGLKIVVVHKSDFATADLFGGADGASPLMPLFSTQSGETSKLPAYCSNEWKRRVIDRYLRQQKIEWDVRWIGFSMDETKRVIRMRYGEEGGRVWFPLVDGEIKCSRRDCVSIVQNFGWATPPRSSCWMCPHMRDDEWREIIKNRPDEFQKAIALEKEIQAVDKHGWLHKSCKPIGTVDFSEKEDLFSELKCESGQCFV